MFVCVALLDMHVYIFCPIRDYTYVQDLMNALHFAALGGHMEVVKYLMPKFGEGKFDMDSYAQTCLHKAVWQGHPKVVQYLIEEGGFDPRLRDKVRRYV